MSFSLPHYLERIGVQGSSRPTLDTLNQLTHAHTKAIAFENLDVILNRGISVDPDALFDKLVTRKRGGYCFEQNGLFLQALTALGFDAKPISARVRVRFATREPDAPRTHIFLRVEMNGESYLTDVGMGAASLTKALRLVENVEQETPHDTRRLVRDRGRWYQQVRYGETSTETWVDTNEFTLEEMPWIDREVANWYTSAHPQSHFKSVLIAARALENGQRLSLLDREFTRRMRSGQSEKTELTTGEAVCTVLAKEFGLELTNADHEGLYAYFQR